MDGILIINKEKKYTSHDVVSKVKKILNTSKVGHTGTLDPNATGVLPLLLNKGTLLSKYLINHDKIYEVSLKLGEKTDTADAEGKVIKKEEVNEEVFEEKRIRNVLESFLGKQLQIPPMYSAIKVKGRKLYEYARKGQTVELEPRQIQIYNINLERIIIEDRVIEFEVGCSKGTYIRSLCEDIAEKLGTIGYMKELNRLKVGEFEIKNSIRLSDLEKMKIEEIKKLIIPVEEIFKDKDYIELNDKNLALFLNGVFSKNSKKLKLKDGLYRIYNNNKFIGIGISKDSELKRDIII